MDKQAINPCLETPRLFLRLGEARDSAAIAAFYARNREYFADSQPARDEAFYSEPFWRERQRSLQDDFDADRGYAFFIFLHDEPSRVIGQCAISSVQRGPMQAAYLGYQLDEAACGNGYMSEALTALIAWAFKDKNLHRLMANYRPSNEKSAAVLKRLGFNIEGYARDYLLLNGRWQDHILSSLINPAFIRNPE